MQSQRRSDLNHHICLIEIVEAFWILQKNKDSLWALVLYRQASCLGLLRKLPPMEMRLSKAQVVGHRMVEDYVEHFENEICAEAVVCSD